MGNKLQSTGIGSGEENVSNGQQEVTSFPHEGGGVVGWVHMPMPAYMNHNHQTN